MSGRRSSAEMEELVRRTYAAVAERTVVGSGADRDVVRLSSYTRDNRGWAQLLVRAAVVVLVAGGVVVLAVRGDGASTGRDGPSRVVPAYVPNAGANGGSGLFALTEVVSDAERDRITYGWDRASISVEVDRARGSLPPGDPVVVRGVEARRTESTSSWVGPGGALVEVSWSGEVGDEVVDDFVRGLLYVDDDTWEELASTGGFRHHHWWDDPVATVRIDADVAFEVSLRGDLHDRIRLVVGSSGYAIGPEMGCEARVNDEITDPEARRVGYVLLADGDVGAATVRTIGADDRQIELTSLRPLADISVGGVVYDDRLPNSPIPRVECEDTP